MAPRKWAELTWEEVRDLGASGRPIAAILPVGAIEAHGPHLPLATDVLIAEGMAEAAARRLDAEGWTAVLLPALPYAAAPFAGAFPGTLSISGEPLIVLVLDLARELTRHRMAALAVANAHLDPAHLECLASIRSRAEAERLIPVICPDLTRKPWALRLTDEFQSGACHAGRFESSVVLASRPDLVRDSIRSALPPNEVSLSRAIRSGARTFEDAGGPRAYFGSPGEATAAEGSQTLETLGAILADAVREGVAADRRHG